MSSVTFRPDGRAEIHFQRFDLKEYRLFLKCKALPESELTFLGETETYVLTTPARFAPLLGLEAPPRRILSGLDIAPHLFDYQAHTLEQALEARRYAVWWDCGLGKTILFNEWMRHVTAATGGKALTLTLPSLIDPTVRMATAFHGDSLPVRILRTRDDLVRWCVRGDGCAIASVHLMVPGQIAEFRHLAGLNVDESSFLKSGGGVIKWNLIHSAKGIEYKLSCTATPAPNDVMEYASQAGFLEKIRNEGQILWTWFSKTKDGDYYLKPHAKEDFYTFLAAWSSYLRNPRRFGWKDGPHDLPQPFIQEHLIPATGAQMAAARRLGLFDAAPRTLLAENRMDMVDRGKAAQVARGFSYKSGEEGAFDRIDSLRPAYVADLARQEAGAGRQVLIWVQFNAEAQLIAEHLRGMAGLDVLDGTVPKKDRGPMVARFEAGQTRVLIAKAKMLGFGQNFQFCLCHIYSGLTDSYEAFYQAIRRSLRYGMVGQLRVHIPYVRELEGEIRNNLFDNKQPAFLRDAEDQERHYLEALNRFRGSLAA